MRRRIEMENLIKEFDLDPTLLNMLQGMRYIFKIENNESDPVEIVTKGGKDVIPNDIFDSLHKQRDEVSKQIEEAGLTDEIQKSRKIYSNDKIFYVFTNKYDYEIINSNDNINYDKNNFFNVQIGYKNKTNIVEKKNIKNDCNNSYISYINILSKLYQILDENGNILFIMNYPSNKYIYFIYLLSLLFEEVYILDRWGIFAKKFKKKMEFIKQIIQIKNNNYDFQCINMKKYKELILFLKKHMVLDIFIRNILLKDKNQFHKLRNFFVILERKETGFNLTPEHINEIKNIIHFFLKTNLNNKESIRKVFIQTPDINILEKIIDKNQYKKGLEIGFIYGLKSISLLENRDINLKSIVTEDIVSKNVIKIMNKMIIKNKKNDLNSYHRIYKESKYIVLSEFLEKKEKFNFIIIQDKNLFDDVLFNFTFGNQLLEENGIIVIMNAQFNPVQLCIQYIEKNMLFYEKIESTATMVIFKKKRNDNRVPNFFVSFC